MLVKPPKSKYNKNRLQCTKKRMLRRRKQVAEKRLRNGYTTGTCAAAAAKAAAAFLLCGKADSDYSELTLPGGTVCRIQVTRYEPEQETESPAFCYFVQKDSGDDPDVTNGTKVFARVRQADKSEFETLCRTGAGYYLEE